MPTPLRLLSLEDNESDLNLILLELQEAGFEPHWERVETERDYLARLDPSLDIILADYSLPQFDAIKALRRRNERGVDVPFIIVSGSIGEDIAVVAMQEGAADYVLKDRLGRLGHAVTRALEQKRLAGAHRQAEQALRESEEKFRSAFDHTNVAMVLTDLDNRFVRANDAFLKLFGYSHDELANLYMEDVTHPDHLSESFVRRRVLLAGEIQHFEMEKRYLHKDGHEFWGLASVSLTRNAQGIPQQYFGQIQDITESKQAVEALVEQDKRLRLAMQAARMGWWVWDIAAHQTTYSDELGHLFGMTGNGGTVSRDVFLALIHEADRQQFTARVEQVLENDIPYETEYRVVWPNGSLHWLASRGQLYRDSTGKPLRVVGVAMDISDRKKAELVSQQQQERMAGIVNSAMDGIITIDEDQRIVLINPAAESMFGYRAEQALGQRVECLMPERFRARHEEHVREFGESRVAARSSGRFGPIIGLRASGEEFPIDAAISQLQMGNHKLFTVTFRDMTERVRAAETKRKLEAQLVQSQKMEAFGQLAGGIAHDFNNLLCVISGYSDILLTMLPANDPKRDSVKAINEAGSRAESLTRQLLAFSRKTVLEPKVINLNEVVRETEKMLGRLLGEDMILTTLPNASIRRVKVDPGLIGQVLMNLAVNARDAMPKGGKLTIETANVELDGQFANAIGDFKPGSYVMLAVSDTGCGMTPEIKARIFEPFFTTKGVGKGTGLGLAVVHGVVSQSAGQIDVESEPGQGTTFKIYLPAVDERVSTTDRVELSKNLRGTETILLVEDEENVRGLQSLILRSYGYQVLVANDGKHALRLVENRQSGIDLLLTDVVMPHVSGRELADLLQPRFPQMKVLFMTGYTDDAVVRHGLVQGQVHLLQKPATPIQLAAKVRSVLDAAG